MSQPNISLICWKQPNKSGYPLKIRILDTINKKYTLIGLKLYLPSLKYWNEETKENQKKIRKSFPQKAEYDKIITVKLIEANNKFGLKQTDKEVKEELHNGRIDFMDALQLQIDDLKALAKMTYVKRFTSIQGHLESYLKTIKKPTLYFDEITPMLLSRFQMYLYSQNISNTTQRESYFKAFKRVYNLICLRNTIVPSNPFISLKFDKDPRRKVKTLKNDAIQKVIDYSLIQRNHLEAFKSKLHFQFSFYGKGIRPADLFTIRWSDISIKTDDYTNEQIQALGIARLNNLPKPIIERNNVLTSHYIMGKTNEDVYINTNNRFLYLLLFYLDESLLKELIYDHKNKIFYEDEDIQLLISKDRFKKPFKDISESFTASNELLKMKPNDYYREDLKVRIAQNDITVINRIVELIKKQQKLTPKGYIFSDINPNLDRDHKDPNIRKSFFNKVSYRQSKINNGLKLVAEHCQLNIDLTSYMARHSYASTLIKETRDILLVKNALKHSDTRITENYLKDLDKDEYEQDRTQNVIDDVFDF